MVYRFSDSPMPPEAGVESPEPEEVEPMNEDELNERLRAVYDEAVANGEV